MKFRYTPSPAQPRRRRRSQPRHSRVAASKPAGNERRAPVTKLTQARESARKNVRCQEPSASRLARHSHSLVMQTRQSAGTLPSLKSLPAQHACKATLPASLPVYQPSQPVSQPPGVAQLFFGWHHNSVSGLIGPPWHIWHNPSPSSSRG